MNSTKLNLPKINRLDQDRTQIACLAVSNLYITPEYFLCLFEVEIVSYSCEGDSVFLKKNSLFLKSKRVVQIYFSYYRPHKVIPGYMDEAFISQRWFNLTKKVKGLNESQITKK